MFVYSVAFYVSDFVCIESLLVICYRTALEAWIHCIVWIRDCFVYFFT